MKIQVDVRWVVTPCSDVAGYQTFRGAILPPSSGWSHNSKERHETHESS